MQGSLLKQQVANSNIKPQKAQAIENPTLSSQSSRQKNAASEFFLAVYFEPLVFASSCLF